MAKTASERAGSRRTGGGRPSPATVSPGVARASRAAREARRHAHAPFSRFRVGAALETRDGRIVTGCNIENASYGLTLCAERVAMFKALSDGDRAFRRVVVAAETDVPTPPCGACRQILWEFGGDLEVILVNGRRELGRWRLRDLLPLPFDDSVLANRRSPARPRAGAAGRPPRTAAGPDRLARRASATRPRR